ncbi:MAG: rhodanese-like domain-containing protein [Bacteroidales bacterium]
MRNENITPLRLGLTVMAGILILGVLFFRIWPLKYDVSIHDSAIHASAQQGLSPVGFWNELRSPGFSAMVVDIRNSDAFNAGHIQDASGIPADEILLKKNVRQMKGKRILIYGDNEQQAHQVALLLSMRGLNAEPVNSSYQHLEYAKLESGKAPVLFYSEEKAAFNYKSFFRAFEISIPEPVELKVPLPKPEGC